MINLVFKDLVKCSPLLSQTINLVFSIVKIIGKPDAIKFIGTDRPLDFPQIEPKIIRYHKQDGFTLQIFCCFFFQKVELMLILIEHRDSSTLGRYLAISEQ